MTEMEPRDAPVGSQIDNQRDRQMDNLLRRSMAAPIPSLSPDFDQRLMRKIRDLRPGAQPLDQYRKLLLTCYGVVSVVASAVVMHGQGLGWGPTAGMILAPLALVAATPPAWRAAHAALGHSPR
jgi:hypothetical protein